MGEKLTLNEKNYNVKLTRSPKGEWTASWGSRLYGTGLSGPTALRRLADALEEDIRFGAADELLSQYKMDPDVLCKYCHAPIFFAVLSSGKFLAFDIEPINGEDAAGERVATFPRKAHTTRGPKLQARFQFEWSGETLKGPVYVPHPVTCGDTVAEPACEVLKARWVANRTVSEERRMSVIEGLRRISAGIEQGDLREGQQESPSL